jgi:hypothetical protein
LSEQRDTIDPAGSDEVCAPFVIEYLLGNRTVVEGRDKGDTPVGDVHQRFCLAPSLVNAELYLMSSAGDPMRPSILLAFLETLFDVRSLVTGHAHNLARKRPLIHDSV